MFVFSLVLAIALMSLAHFLRVLRTELFVRVYEKPDRKRLLQALSLGYFVNTFVPFKLGDLVKGFYAGKKMKNGRALGLSTVLVDRYLDILIVGIIFSVLALVKKGDYIASSKFYIYFLIVLVAFTALVFVFRGILKKLVRKIAGIFNPKIEVGLLRFAWALIWNFKDIFFKINKLYLSLLTFGMWGVYILSYFAFAMTFSLMGINTQWTDIFVMLFGENGVTASTLMLSIIGGEITKANIVLIIYMLAPIAVIAAVSFMAKAITVAKEDEKGYLNLLPQLNPEERLIFLDMYFGNENKDYIDNYLKINSGISVIRDYSAGSEATTMLCVDERGTFFRKYAFGKAGDKLSKQIEWIKENSDKLPLPGILKSEVNDIYAYYDMPYLNTGVGMFEYVHSMPVSDSFGVIKHVFESMEASIHNEKKRPALKADIEKYIDEKVIKNLSKIFDNKKLKSITEAETVFVNGRELKNLSFYRDFLSKENLIGIFEKDFVATIHGDLTIENIVCNRGADRSFYLIDPNTGNVLDSPMLDYAKLLQSLHGGYEFLMSVRNVSVNENRIDFLFTKSSQYADLYEAFDKYITGKFCESEVKSIYMHELVHWLRLLPYKLEKDINTAPAFYAGLLLVLDDIYTRFGAKNE